MYSIHENTCKSKKSTTTEEIVVLNSCFKTKRAISVVC
nr:MAG TPA: hypothetical protein [Caudoviricetes sp.]